MPQSFDEERDAYRPRHIETEDSSMPAPPAPPASARAMRRQAQAADVGDPTDPPIEPAAHGSDVPKAETKADPSKGD